MTTSWVHRAKFALSLYDDMPALGVAVTGKEAVAHPNTE